MFASSRSPICSVAGINPHPLQAIWNAIDLLVSLLIDYFSDLKEFGNSVEQIRWSLALLNNISCVRDSYQFEILPYEVVNSLFYDGY